MHKAFFALLLLLGSALPAQGQTFDSATHTLSGAPAPVEFLPVEEAYTLAIAVREGQPLRLYWQISDGYYLYQHRFSFRLQDAAGEIALDVQLPEGERKSDEFFGDVVVYYREADILLQPARTPAKATLTVTSQGCADAGLCYPPHTQTFAVDIASGSATPLAPPARPGSAADSSGHTTTATAPTAGASLIYMLLLAFIGGAILNLMPCVFPILSLKVLSFARSSDHDRHLHSWVYTAGVIVSFVLVAALLIALQQAGRAIGWGFQLQSPGFVIGLAYLFIAMGLSLSGVIALGGSLMNAGSGLASRSGPAGSFFTGVLAVIVASPCTAPFMGTALGFALGQPAPVALSVFAALGAGMAAPLLLFSYSGAARALMPRPGAWMETLKQFLAFPLYATAIWLLWVAGRQTGVNTMAAALGGALLVALGLWLWSPSRWRRAAAFACLAAALGLGSLRGLDAPESAAALPAGAVAWSEHGVQSLRRDGKPVFVDVTADWCITCKANEAAVLKTDEISAAFAEHGVVYMVADWTNQDANIARMLLQFQRSGIPLYLMYPANPALQPMILPQILTKRIVLEAIDAVSVKNAELTAVFGDNRRD